MTAPPIPTSPKLDEELPRPDVDELEADDDWSDIEVCADLSGWVRESLHVTGCRVVRSELRRADVTGARIVDTLFVDCDISGAVLQQAVLTRVEFRNCRMSGLIANASKMRDVRVSECKADGLGMRSAATERTLIERTLLQRADFSAASLRSTRLFDCDLDMADFTKARLDDVKVHGSTLRGLRGLEDLRGITIDDEQWHALAIEIMAANRILVGERDDDVVDRDQRSRGTTPTER